MRRTGWDDDERRSERRRQHRMGQIVRSQEKKSAKSPSRQRATEKWIAKKRAEYDAESPYLESGDRLAEMDRCDSR